jgi:hypothetical protein
MIEHSTEDQNGHCKFENQKYSGVVFRVLVEKQHLRVVAHPSPKPAPPGADFDSWRH